MKSERWARLKDLLDQALDLAPELRPDFIERECGSDTELRQQLEELLAASQDLDDFIAPPKDHVIPVDKIFSSANEEGLVGNIGGYRLIQELGRGGRGVVYLAKPEDSDRLVALKILSLAALPSAVSVERFQREARSVERLEHPAIVKVRSLEQDLGRPFLVMDYIDGPDLASEISKLQVGAEVDRPSVLRAKDEKPAELAARLVKTLAEAAHHAHGRGIVHRDIKPQNVLLDKEGQPHLVDFGLARDDAEATLTRTGEVEGTPNYMSPEQVRAERNQVDHRTDIYSLGVVLYELLTLKRPFEAPTANQVMSNITSRAPIRVRKINAEVPRDLELVCMKAMENNPRHRYQSAAELADDLGRFLLHEGVLAKAPNPAQVIARQVALRPVPWGIGAAALLILLIAPIVSGWASKSNSFRELEETLADLNLVEGEYENIPDLRPALSQIRELERKYGSIDGSLGDEVNQLQSWIAVAKEQLDRQYLTIERVRVGIGYWLPVTKAPGQPTDKELMDRYAAGLTALGYSPTVAFGYLEARLPLVSVRLRQPELADSCSIYLAYFIPQTGGFSPWVRQGTVAELAGGFRVEPDTPYRLGLKTEDGLIAECTLMKTPKEGKRELLVGLNRMSDLDAMIQVEAGQYSWNQSKRQGGPTTPFDVPAFRVDETLVTMGEYLSFLEESNSPTDHNMPTDPELIEVLRDRAAVYILASDMAAFAAWNGKRLITAPEFRLASGGPDLAFFPAGVQPEGGHETMPFGALHASEIPEEEVPELWGLYWYWMTLVLPSVNEIAEYDQGPSGMKMIWATVSQMTESVAFQHSAEEAGNDSNSPASSNMVWAVAPSRLEDSSDYLDRGLDVMRAQSEAIADRFTGFRCAISENPIP